MGDKRLNVLAIISIENLINSNDVDLNKKVMWYV